MGNRLYFLEELPETYGRLQGFCTDLFLGQMQQKAQELQLFRQAIIYGELRAAFRQSQRRKDRWPIKVAQFNETLAACINMGRRITEEAHLQLEYKKNRRRWFVHGRAEVMERSRPKGVGAPDVPEQHVLDPQ
nr:V3 [Trifolium virus 1]